MALVGHNNLHVDNLYNFWCRKYDETGVDYGCAEICTRLAVDNFVIALLRAPELSSSWPTPERF